jgi:hypothetical protein
MSEKSQTIRQEKCNLIQITSNYFCAGIELRGIVVIRTAPILRYMKGWTRYKVEQYSTRKGWQYNVVRN